MAVFLGFLGVLGFSFSLPATRVAVEDLDPTFVGVGRAVVAGLLAVALLAATRQPRPTRAQLQPLALVALGVVFGFPLFTALAMHSLPSAQGAVIVGVLPAATAVAAVLFAGERPSRAFWAASGAGLLAVLVFAGAQGAGLPSGAHGLVLIAVALCALGYAKGGALSRELGGWQTICWALVLSLPLTVPITLVTVVAGDLSGGADAWAGFAYVSLVSMFLGFFAWYAGLARGGIARIGQVQLAQPVLTLLWAALLLGEDVTAGMVAAALIVLACVVATQRTRVAAAERTGIAGSGPGAAPRASSNGFSSLRSVTDSALLDDRELLNQGKVRDVYAEGDDRLLMVVSDRISTYDVVHPNPIPDKGKVLTGLTAFWLERTEPIVPNHLLSFTDVPEAVRGRGMLVEKLEMAPVECVVRGYITGSGWKDYQRSGEICGIALPDGLEESQQLPEPIFTPATKAEVGDHDENVDFDRAAEILGDRALLEELRRISIELYEFGAAHARERGIILADTKFEFGRRPDGTIVLGDEVLTPDSSRFWPADGYEPGHGQPQLRQAVRARLGLAEGLGQVAARARAARGRRRQDPRAVRGRLRAHHRRAVPGLAGPLRVKVSVLIRPKEGILDPQGQAVERALPALGFDGRERRARRPAGRARGGRRRRGRPPCARSCWPTR